MENHKRLKQSSSSTSSESSSSDDESDDSEAKVVEVQGTEATMGAGGNDGKTIGDHEQE